MEPPPEKKARTEEALEGKKEETQAEQDAEMKEADTKEEPPKEPEPPKENEQDAPAEKGKPRIKEDVKFLVPDTTLNVMQSTTGDLLMTLCDGGIQHLFAGARANVGVKSGRYMFEVKVVEYMNPVEDHASRGAPRPKNLVRVGFSTASASLIMGETSEGCVCFDSDGAFVQPKKRTPVSGRFAQDEVVAVLLNLDEKSENFNTVSLFKDGVRASQPQPLPESLKGQALFPTVSFKQMTVHVNFGREPLAPLPFLCRMMQDISQKDAQLTSYPSTGGKNEVVFPVGLPDEGAFDWLDTFHEKNPGYTELSDRMILDWAEKSGIWKTKGYKTSNDKPEMAFGIRELDDGSVRRVVHSAALLQARNFVVMELKANLIKSERKESTARFPCNRFKKVAAVIVGDPTADFKKKTNEQVLKVKQEKSDAEFKAKKAEETRQKLMEKRAKELEKAKKKAEKERKKAEKEIKKKLAAEKKAKEEAAKKEAAEKKAAEEDKTKEDEDMEKKEGKKEEDEKKEGEHKEEEKKEEENNEEEKKEEKEEEVDEEEAEEEEEPEKEEEEKEEPEEEPPKVQLTPEEKKVVFFKHATPDLTPYVLSTSLGQFSLPEKEDGFDDIKYEWNKTAQKALDHMKTWISDKKLTTRVEDIRPSEWFNQKWAEWQKHLQLWQAKQGEYKMMVNNKQAAKAAKKAAVAAAKEAAKKEAAAKEAAAKEAAKETAEKKEGEPAPMDVDKEEEKKDEKEEDEVEEEEEELVDFEDLDVFGVDNILNVAASTPLFKDFQFEDWTMMSLRFELHLLAHAFRHDVEDKEREGIHLDNLAFYYNRYYPKGLSTRHYGVDTFAELVDLVSDAVYATKKQVLESQLDAEMECLQIFAKLTEEARRHRALRLALGEESARLKLAHPAQFAPAQQGQGPRGGKRGGKGWFGDSKGSGKGGKSGYGAGGGFQQHHSGPWQQQPPRTVAPRMVRPPAYRQQWNDGKGKGK